MPTPPEAPFPRKEAENRMSKNHVHVGIDLGTSRSSISTSHGSRHVVESYVGWPADMVARKVLKKDVLVGRDALPPLVRPLGESGSALAAALGTLAAEVRRSGSGDDLHHAVLVVAALGALGAPFLAARLWRDPGDPPGPGCPHLPDRSPGARAVDGRCGRCRWLTGRQPWWLRRPGRCAPGHPRLCPHPAH